MTRAWSSLAVRRRVPSAAVCSVPDMATHMRHTVGVDAPPAALCDSSITADLAGSIEAVTCVSCRRETGRIIADQEMMRWQAEAENGE